MIPTYKPVDTTNVGIAYIDEPFVDIAAYSNGLIIVDMQYSKRKYKGAINVAYVRKRVADMLIKAAHILPDGMHIKVWDAWRSIETQTYLYNKYYNRIKQEYPYLKDPELTERVEQFISKPGHNYLHGTGGAIDVTLVDDNGNDLNMGTQFDEFNNKTRTDYFEHRYNLRILFNRRILYDAMINAGFVNNPEEWWHFDYGDAIWAELTKNNIKYKSVSNLGGINV